ncbi:MAG: TIGR03557 family F420-dependent LLM class oxidoreductase [Nocardioidaceae bacterium]
MRYFHFCSHEQFPPLDLLVQARRAQAAGFDGLACSDHLQPWWEPGEAANAWVWLGAAAQATARIPFGTGVTPPGPRYHPVVIAQAWATFEAMFPGRPFLGVGSGEALNESPLGADWPPVRAQIELLEEALGLIHRLFAGERVTHEGTHFSARRALLHTRPARRPPLYVSAFGARAAGVAGRLGDGLWTLGDPESAPAVIDAYRAAAEDAGRAPGEILLQVGFSWAPDDDAALAGCRAWKAAQPPEFYKDEWDDPRAMQEKGAREVSDDDLRESFIVSSDPDVHIERIRALESLGATTIVLANNSGADPLGAIDVYGQRVLPALRRARAGA